MSESAAKQNTERKTHGHVIYNTVTNKFRSGRSTGGYKKSFSSAVVYTHEHQAKRACKSGDITIPIEINLDPEDIVFAALSQQPTK